MLRRYRYLRSAALQTTAVIITALIGGVLIYVAPLRAADPTAIACPNGQTVMLEGDGPPREALLIFLGMRAVGGGIADASGRFRLPLRANERPGIYPVEVRLRATDEVVVRFSCYIDLPLDTDLTTPSPSAAPPPTSRAQPATATPARAASPSATPGGTPSPSATSGGTPSPSATPGRGTPSPSATPGGTPSPTGTSQSVQPGLISITAINLRDSVSPQDRDELVVLTSTTNSPLNLSGWRLSNASRTDVPAYIFPAFTLSSGSSINIFSTSGQDDLESGELFWGQLGAIWRPGDRAELRDVAGRLVTSLIVSDE